VRGFLVFALIATPAAAQDVARGRLLFLQCRACHSVNASEPNKIGPNLNGFLKRPGASAAGFKYSSAFSAARPVWTDASLDKWLTRPGAMVPGTTMAFAGVAKPADRAAIIAYLKQATK
jgi:cytochrome c